MQLGPCECDVLVLAADELALEIGATLRRRRASAWPLLLVSHPGDALRHVIRCRSKLLLICATAARIEPAAAFIAELSRRRKVANHAPLVALAAAHDEVIERAARIAGATHYLALDSPADELLLDQLLEDVGIRQRERDAPPSRSAPAQRGVPPPRAATRRPSDRSRPWLRT